MLYYIRSTMWLYQLLNLYPCSIQLATFNAWNLFDCCCVQSLRIVTRNQIVNVKFLCASSTALKWNNKWKQYHYFL